jgi:hypothetical protein
MGLAALAMLVVWGARQGLVQMGAYDLSALVAMAWRDHLGQRAGVDYPFTLPPALLLLARAAWTAGPVTLVSLLVAGAVATLAQMALVDHLARALPDPARLALAACVAVPTVASGIPWHSALTSTLALCLAVAVVEQRRGWIVVLAAVVALCKPNVAGPALLVAAVDAPGLVAAGGALGAVAMLVGGVDPVEQLVTYWALLDDRGALGADVAADIDAWGRWGRLAIELAAGVVALRALRLDRRAELGLLFVAAGACGLLTNWDIVDHDMPLVLGGVVLAAPSLRASRALLAAVLAHAVIVGARRDRARYVGDFYDDGALVESGVGVYAGVVASPRWWAVVDEVRRATDGLDPDARVFLGPRLELLYPEIGRAPLFGLPVWWHLGASYLRRDYPRIDGAFEREPPDLAILLDAGRLPSGIAGAIRDLAPCPDFVEVTVRARGACPHQVIRSALMAATSTEHGRSPVPLTSLALIVVVAALPTVADEAATHDPPSIWNCTEPVSHARWVATTPSAVRSADCVQTVQSTGSALTRVISGEPDANPIPTPSAIVRVPLGDIVRSSK